MFKEGRATDYWNRSPKYQLKNSSYHIPNPYLRHIKLGKARDPRILPLSEKTVFVQNNYKVVT